MAKTSTALNVQADPLAVLESALVTLGSHFVEMTERQDKATGELVEVNLFAYTQERVLNGVAYTLELQAKQTEKTLDKAAGELRGIMRSYRGDEISKKNLESKQSFIERLVLQLETIRAAFAVACKVHEDLVGKPYTDADTQRAERARQTEEAAKSPLPELAGAANLLKSIGIREPSHPALSMDRLDRSQRA
jgi:hypothetical protein